MLLVIAAAAVHAGLPLFVGAKTCGACHPRAYEQWAASPHARAFELLPAQAREKPQCLQCHSLDREESLRGVQCESCHGPGAQYAADYVMKDRVLAESVGLVTSPAVGQCKGCHREHSPDLNPPDLEAALKVMKARCQGKAPTQPPPAAPTP